MKFQFLFFAFLLASCASTEATATPTPGAESAVYLPTLFQVREDARASQSRLDDERPNIILILTDDQPFETVQFMPTVRDVLIKYGINFENGFVTTPLCCPSRSSILTGQYAHNHQVLTNRMPLGGAPKLDVSSTIATWLSDAGYVTGYFGKYLNSYDDIQPYGAVPPGWDEWATLLDAEFFNYNMTVNGTIEKHGEAPDDFSADVTTRNAVDFIVDSKDEPFFMTVGYFNPHSPYTWAERHHAQFRANSALTAEPYRNPAFMEEDRSDKPKYLQELNSISVEKIDITYKQILRSLLSVDDGVASILNALDKTGLSDKTVIVYLSDNGLTVGDHGFGLTKNCPYESCIRVPFIMYAPGMFPARAETGFAANIDLAPTFADLAGISAPVSVDGISLLPLIGNANTTWRDDLLFEHWPTEDGIGSLIPEFYAVRTAEWKYVEYSTGERELYDLINDPYELNNLADRPEYAEIQSQLKARLDALKKE
ncbi:MAG: sulfatase [Chloroflexi bacterium]|nr:sulfatase [Chloroflexota bacterium]